MKNFTRIALLGVAGVVAAGAAQAQVATNNLITAQTGQTLVGASVGNGVQQTSPIATVKGNGRPLVGVGALSGSPDHYGSAASVSVANSDRLLGIDGPGGPSSGNSISINNPRKAPLLSAGHR